MFRFLNFRIPLSVGLVACLVTGSIGAQEQNENVKRVIKMRDSDDKQPSLLDPSLVESEEIAAKTVESTEQAEVPTEIKPNETPVKPPMMQQKSSRVAPTMLPTTNGPAPQNSSRNQVPGMNSTTGIKVSGDNWLSKTKLPVSGKDESPGLVETMEAPSIQTQILAPKSIILNQPAQLHVRVRNSGKSDVARLKLIAVIPDHAKFVSSTPQPTTVQGRTYEFGLSNLGVSDSQIVRMELIPTQKQPLSISTSVQVVAQQQVAVSVRQPVLELRTTGARRIQTGQKVKHLLTVTNVGDGIAKQVRVETNRPQSLESTGNSENAYIEALEPGKSANFEIVSFAREPGDANVQFQVTALGADAKQTQASVLIIQPEIKFSAMGPKRTYLEHDGVYTLQLENIGQIDVNDVQLELGVPQGLKVTTISQKAKINSSRNSLIWNLNTFPSNRKTAIQFRAKAIQEGTHEFRIDVKTRETDSNSFLLATHVLSRTDLSIRVFDPSNAVSLGTSVDFQVEVQNRGSREAKNLQVVVDLPQGLMAVNNPNYRINENKSQVYFSNLNIGPKDKLNLTFAAVAVEHGEHIVRGSVRLNGAQAISTEDSVFVFDSDENKVSEALTPVIRR